MISPIVPAPVLSRPTVVDGIGQSGLRVEIEVTADERRALAQLNGLPEVQSFTASFLLRPEPRGGVGVVGEVRAKVVQTCVVSLDPFEADVASPVDVHFLPEAQVAAHRAARLKRLSDPSNTDVEEDEPDSVRDGRIDLGALAAEYLTIGLDPYPKKPGVEFVEPVPHAAEPDASPFAVLKALKREGD